LKNGNLDELKKILKPENLSKGEKLEIRSIVKNLKKEYKLLR